MPRITLSYRRLDAAGITGRIFDRLASHFGEESVFMDVDTIPLGVDFRHYIDGALKDTDFLLVVIGSQWLGPRPGDVNRIDDNNDPVRLEVAAALKNDVTTVIPLLIDDTPMPTSSVLPQDLEQLSYLQAAAVSSGKDFSTHIARVINFINASAEKRDVERVTAEAAQHEKERLAAEAAQREEERRLGEVKKIEERRRARELKKKGPKPSQGIAPNPGDESGPSGDVGTKSRPRQIVAFDRARSRRQIVYLIIIVTAISVAIAVAIAHSS